MNRLLEHYRCPALYFNAAITRECRLFDALEPALLEALMRSGDGYLVADADEIIDNLRYERYVNPGDSARPQQSGIERIYYFLRPALPVAVRKHMQRARLRGWQELPFPRWPVDTTVDDLLERLLLRALAAQGHGRIPFIWFWPDGAPGCAILTHDIESSAGLRFCSTLMSMDAAYEVPASFQIVPEERYPVPARFLDTIREQGFEINVQDLNHDGLLFRDRREFLRRVAKINRYGEKFKARGFRSAVLYRRQEWFEALRFEYDMSVPNVARLDPQRGGCCTVMPYFVGDILELPLTTTQDYSLFYILNDYSLDLWKRQIELILHKHGLMSFIIHPDYLSGTAARRTFESLLSHLTELRARHVVWIASPGEVNTWWRQRAQMTLVEDALGCHIEGPGKERACIAYAYAERGRLEFEVHRDGAAVGHGLQPATHPTGIATMNVGPTSF